MGHLPTCALVKLTGNRYGCYIACHTTEPICIGGTEQRPFVGGIFPGHGKQTG